jgi:predicted Zn-dependent protease
MHSDHKKIWQGRLSDGKSALASPVDVELCERGVAIRPFGGGGGEPLVWPYGALETATPLGKGATDALISYRHQPGATLFVHGADFAAGLARFAPHLTTRAQRMAHATPWLWAAAAVALIAAGVWALQLSPSTALARLIPDKTRVALGKQVVRSMAGERKVCEAAAGKAALGRLVARLSEAAGGAKPFKVVVVDWGMLNAFAAPGEQIVLTRGLVNKAASPDEVAGVLAHEMGHGLELHPEAGLVRAIGMSAAADLVMGGGAGTIGNIGVLLAQLSYTRAAEREADAHAFRILKAAAIAPKGIADFFRRVQKIEGGGDSGKGFSGIDAFRTHPQTEERARQAENQPPYPATPALNAADWQALREICGSPSKP